MADEVISVIRLFSGSPKSSTKLVGNYVFRPNVSKKTGEYQYVKKKKAESRGTISFTKELDIRPIMVPFTSFLCCS